jgi:putative transposase
LVGRNKVHRLYKPEGVQVRVTVRRKERVSPHRVPPPPPFAIAIDHRTEFTSKALEERFYLRGVKLDFIRPVKTTKNGKVETFNGRLRDECPSVNEFATPDDVKTVFRAWRHDYNHCRPHGLLGNPTPSGYGRK